MKIAYLINCGVDIHSQNTTFLRIKVLIDRVRSRGHEVYLVALDGRRVIITNEWDFHQTALANYSENPILNLFESGARRVQGALDLPYYAIFDSFRFYDACINNLDTFDILHERSSLFGWGAQRANQKFRLPHLLDIEADYIKELDYTNQPLKGIHRKYATGLFSQALQSADAITVVSNNLKSEFTKNWHISDKKIHVLPNGVDPEIFRPISNPQRIRLELGLPDDILVMFVGSFYPWHDIATLIRAFNLVIQSNSDVKLVLVGDGKIKFQIMKLVEDLRLTSHVLFTGQVDYKDVPKYLAVADICIAPYPNIRDGIWFSPLKVFEYMASGKPVIASRSGQLIDILDNEKTGYLIEPENIGQLSERIIWLINHPMDRLRLGENARTEIIEKHSWEAYITKLEGIYYRIIENAQ